MAASAGGFETTAQDACGREGSVNPAGMVKTMVAIVRLRANPGPCAREWPAADPPVGGDARFLTRRATGAGARVTIDVQWEG